MIEYDRCIILTLLCIKFIEIAWWREHFLAEDFFRCHFCEAKPRRPAVRTSSYENFPGDSKEINARSRKFFFKDEEFWTSIDKEFFFEVLFEELPLGSIMKHARTAQLTQLTAYSLQHMLHTASLHPGGVEVEEKTQRNWKNRGPVQWRELAV